MKTYSYAFSLLNTNNHYNEKVLGRGTMSASHINSPNYYGFQAGDSPLIEGSSRIGSSHSLTKSEEKSAVVNLSSMAMEMSKILLKENTATASPAEFDDFLEKMHGQLQEMVEQEAGNIAEILLEHPNSVDTTRLAIAEQAANHLMSKFYNSDEPYPQAPSENPFAELDRHSLSTIAFDDSGDFTSAERYLAFLQMTENDTDFRNQAFELRDNAYAAEDNYAGAAIDHMARRVDAKLISGMTEAERAWRGVSAVPEENKLAQADNGNLAELPAYTNGVKASLESFFVVEGDENGGVLRSIDIRSVLENEEEGMSLLKMALRSLEQKDSEES
ncbi:hypothetical protein QT231_14770 [Halomonas sp. SpR1]|uniref:hypothetical protein n=1 Tax=Halomonas sp. SpR1 TaxID=3050462 RepID=UPI0027E4B307|nr:hypothetical protein [Halomonas sp. SpR1]MDQ7733971.1 hypothetical protein [Halomonas sp. SpR1]